MAEQTLEQQGFELNVKAWAATQAVKDPFLVHTLTTFGNSNASPMNDHHAPHPRITRNYRKSARQGVDISFWRAAKGGVSKILAQMTGHWPKMGKNTVLTIKH